MAAVLVSVPDRQDPNKKDAPASVHDQLLGEWRMEKAVVLGQNVMDKKDAVLIFEKDVIQVRENGQIKERDGAGYRIDTTKTPIAFDLTPKNGPPDMKVIQGILKIERDELVICFSAGPNAARPTDFQSGQDGATMVMYLRRVKK
jgi:uncharacterized protein (TIGR03067 family)